MDNNSTIIKDIEEIISKYINKSDDCINQFRYDEDENEFWLKEELKDYFNKSSIESEIKIVDAYSSCSYEVDILCISYKDNLGKIHLYTEKLELH